MEIHERVKKETIPDGWVVPSAKSVSIFWGGVGDNKETVLGTKRVIVVVVRVAERVVLIDRDDVWFVGCEYDMFVVINGEAVVEQSLILQGSTLTERPGQSSAKISDMSWFCYKKSALILFDKS